MYKNFALMGAAGYIAPRHMQAIKDTDNRLVAAFDPFDSVGILDRYFYDVDFFTEFERFDRHLELLRRNDEVRKIDYISICSPNYLHDAHVRFALRIGAYPICEKPLVINPWNLDGLAELERESGIKIYNVLQLRLHQAIIDLKNEMANKKVDKKYEIDLTYITSRGKWYFYSWKGELEKSGGMATNVGIHFFDMLLWIFGSVNYCEVHYADTRKISGFIELENARIRWFLSIDKNDLPDEAVKEGKPTYRSILINNKEVEFSGGFTDLHTTVYRDILNGNGYGIEDARPSIELVHTIRHIEPKLKKNDLSHPFLSNV